MHQAAQQAISAEERRSARHEAPCPQRGTPRHLENSVGVKIRVGCGPEEIDGQALVHRVEVLRANVESGAVAVKPVYLYGERCIEVSSVIDVPAGTAGERYPGAAWLHAVAVIDRLDVAEAGVG